MHITPPQFKPPAGLRNRHLQTILSSVGPRRIRLRKAKRQLRSTAQKLILDAGDGVRLLGFLNRPLDPSNGQCDANLASTANDSTLVILIHGWEGSDESSYMLSAASTLIAAGFSVMRLNLRDHGDSHHLNEAAFNSTLLDEVVGAIKTLQSEHKFDQYHLAGFSLGGNFALRVAAAAVGHDISLTSVSAFCPVVHAELANSALVEPRNWLYNAYFVRKWKRSLQLKSKHFPKLYNQRDFATLKSLDEMNQTLIPKYTSFSELSDYFDAYAIVDDRLSQTVCPCYLHFASDDMIIPVEGVARINMSHNLQIEITDHGGHCGYISNWGFDSWQDERLLQIVRHFNK